MEIYIEYAFIENFLLDGMLLYLSLRIVKAKISRVKLLASATVGAVFAIVFPLISLSVFWTIFIKTAVGLLLCLLAFPSIKRKKEWGRYALSCIFFFSCSFCLGGALLAVFGGFSASKNGYEITRVKAAFVLLGGGIFLLICEKLIKIMRKKNRLYRHIYNCAIAYKQRSVATLGFLDSGNMATKNGLPVCFVSPDLAYDILGEELMYSSAKDEGQVCDEMQIHTVNGEKAVRLFLGEIEVFIEKGKSFKQQSYFAVSSNMVSKEYKIILHSLIIKGIEELLGEQKK